LRLPPQQDACKPHLAGHASNCSRGHNATQPGPGPLGHLGPAGGPVRLADCLLRWLWTLLPVTPARGAACPGHEVRPRPKDLRPPLPPTCKAAIALCAVTSSSSACCSMLTVWACFWDNSTVPFPQGQRALMQSTVCRAGRTVLLSKSLVGHNGHGQIDFHAIGRTGQKAACMHLHYGWPRRWCGEQRIMNHDHHAAHLCPQLCQTVLHTTHYEMLQHSVIP
jgi:hypothetical protein